MKSPTYILDANVFIQASNEYYPLDLVPGFWDTLTVKAESGVIGSIDLIRKELEREEDQLWSWVRDEFHSAFHSTQDPDVLAAYREVITWATRHEQFFDYAKREFAEVADAWLVAYALAKECTVVTQEKLAPDMKRKIQIPNVCVAFGVTYMDTFQLLRALDVRWGNL